MNYLNAQLLIYSEISLFFEVKIVLFVMSSYNQSFTIIIIIFIFEDKTSAKKDYQIFAQNECCLIYHKLIYLLCSDLIYQTRVIQI